MFLKQVSDVFGEIGLAQLDVKFLAKVLDLVMIIINVGAVNKVSIWMI
jgi:hypothetical protein